LVSEKVHVHVGNTFAALTQRVAGVWHRAERQEAAGDTAERHVGFQTFELFARIMTPSRLALLRHVHRQRPKGVQALAHALGRDEADVQEADVQQDVDALVDAGLPDRDSAGLHADSATLSVESRVAL
jgi:predicted transcriptional regulator